jgi:signal transduction histidine kinase
MTRTSWSPLRPRLRAPTSQNESLRIERVISVARLLMAAIALVQLRIDPIEPASYQPIAFLLFTLFAAHSVSALVVLRTRQQTSPAFVSATFTVDVLSAAVTLPIAAPTNSFFVFFLFVIATTAFRRGFRETVAITLLSIALVLVHARLLPVLTVESLASLASFEFDRTIGRVAYLAMIGLLLGYLAEEGRLLRAEAAAVTKLLSRVRADSGLARATTAVAKEVLTLFNAGRLLLVMEHRETQRLFRWDTSGGWGVTPALAEEETDAPDRTTFFFCPSEVSLGASRRWWPARLTSPHHITAVDETGRVVDGSRIRVPDRFTAIAPFRCVLSVPVVFGEDWSGRLFLFEPRIEARQVALTQFFQSVVRQVVPAMFSVHLTGQLQERAGALERARVARELHDGVIQSLIAAEMQIDVLKRQDPIKGTSSAADLGRLQRAIKDEVLNLRELMQHMRPPEFDPDELLAYIADMVQRFGRDSGISAVFVSEVDDVRLPWRVCLELVRIVQEGLVNVRKHSAASNVIVRFGVREGHWTLEIDDNGHGFPFEGRFSQADLESGRRGPTIIKERVKAIGGHLAIDSTPRGTKLEILVPQNIHG